MNIAAAGRMASSSIGMRAQHFRRHHEVKKLAERARFQPRTRTSLKLTSTRPPACGRPKLNCGRKRENSIT